MWIGWKGEGLEGKGMEGEGRGGEGWGWVGVTHNIYIRQMKYC